MLPVFSRSILTAVVTGACLLAGTVAEAQSTKLRKLGTQNDALAWQSVGRLDLEGKGYCTGTLIAPDMVLTAAHCVYDGSRLMNPGEITFRAGLTEGTASAERKAIQIEAHAGYVPGRRPRRDNTLHDVAMVRLAKPIPTSELDPFAIYDGDLPNGPVSVVSYGRGRSSAMSRQRECEVTGRWDRLLVMDCDVTFGSSGSPVFTHINGRGQIVSVMSAIGNYQGQKVAFGMTLGPLISDLKRQMYANKPRPGAQMRRITVGGGNRTSGAKFVTPGGS